MPRRRQRFADLERQFRNNGGVADPDSDLGRYIAFKQGKRRIQVKRPVLASERKRFVHAILPFNLYEGATIEATDYYAAPITLYSERGRRTFAGITNVDWGYTDVTADTKRNDNFYPALIKVKVITNPSEAPEPEVSGITGRPYKVKVGRSYSIPFGKRATAPVQGEENRRLELTELMKAVDTITTGSFSYEPEIFRIGAPDPEAVPSTLPAVGAAT